MKQQLGRDEEERGRALKAMTIFLSLFLFNAHYLLLRCCHSLMVECFSFSLFGLTLFLDEYMWLYRSRYVEV